MYTEFIGNSYIRNAGEAVLNGVRLAQTQAVKVNTSAAFVLDPATGWTVHAPDPDDAQRQGDRHLRLQRRRVEGDHHDQFQRRRR